MLSPIQQIVLPLDPLRQQVTWIPSVQPPAPANDPTVLPSVPAPDPLASQPGNQHAEAQDQASTNQQSDAASKLSAAWARLAQLEQAAGQAVRSGNRQMAQEVAMEATQLASSIGASLPGISAGTVETVATQTTGHAATTLDAARAGLSAAKGVIDMAQSLPTHAPEDHLAFEGMRRQVLQTMAGVEALATRVGPATSKTVAHYNMTA